MRMASQIHRTRSRHPAVRLLCLMIVGTLSNALCAPARADAPPGRATASPTAVTQPAVPQSRPASPVAHEDDAHEDDIAHAVTQIWSFEIARFDNRPITVGTMVLGALLLVVGIWLSRLLSAMLGRRILPRVGVNTGAAVAYQRVFFYLLLLVFTLIALNIVNVPLTVFTVLGGAIAIGVGFGAQNIINNFISGWILLAERQVNIGDLVEVEGTVGYVRTIGARCTHVRRSDGIDLLIPNSLMLERTVVNWTLTDADIRTTVRVGVVYGAAVDKVVELIRTAVDEHDKILPRPAPEIIFEDFGDNALVFDVYFWVHTSAEMELRIVRSDVRFMLERLFRAAGIVIAFPQRDVHLDSTRPLEVRMLPAAERRRSTAGPQPSNEADGEDAAPMFGAPTPDCTAAMLRAVEPLRSLGEAELRELARGAQRRELAAGENVVEQGAPGASLFVVAQGLLRVTVLSQGRTQRVGKILPGGFFGEASLLTGEPRSATVTAATAAMVFEIDRDMLAPMLERRPEVVRKLSAALATRKMQTDAHLERLAGGNEKIQRTLVAELRGRISSFFGLSHKSPP